LATDEVLRQAGKARHGTVCFVASATAEVPHLLLHNVGITFIKAAKIIYEDNSGKYSSIYITITKC